MGVKGFNVQKRPAGISESQQQLINFGEKIPFPKFFSSLNFQVEHLANRSSCFNLNPNLMLEMQEKAFQKLINNS